jgi:transcriptional regulator with XRE-family HTH domain
VNLHNETIQHAAVVKHTRNVYVCRVTPQSEPTDFNQRVAANIRRFRKAAGMSQAELAHELTARGFSWVQQTVVRVENGSQPLKLEEAATVGKVLGVDVSVLSGSAEDEEIAAAIADLRAAIEGGVHSRRRIAELEDEARYFEEMKREAERRLAQAGAWRNEDGSWHWREEDGSEGEFRGMGIGPRRPIEADRRRLKEILNESYEEMRRDQAERWDEIRRGQAKGGSDG